MHGIHSQLSSHLTDHLTFDYHQQKLDSKLFGPSAFLFASKMRLWSCELGLAAALTLVTVASGQEDNLADLDFSRYQTDLFPHPFHSSAKQSPPPWYLQNIGDGDKDCPPCFNCMLPAFECKHFANCSEYDGKCKVRDSK